MTWLVSLQDCLSFIIMGGKALERWQLFQCSHTRIKFPQTWLVARLESAKKTHSRISLEEETEVYFLFNNLPLDTWEMIS